MRRSTSCPPQGSRRSTCCPIRIHPSSGAFRRAWSSSSPRAAADAWRFTTSNLLPGFKRERGKLLKVIGFSNVAPSIMIGGPLIPSKLFLRRALVRYNSQRSPQPRQLRAPQARIIQQLHPARRQCRRPRLFARGQRVSRHRTFANLDTFTPPAATYNVRQRCTTSSSPIGCRSGRPSCSSRRCTPAITTCGWRSGPGAMR